MKRILAVLSLLLFLLGIAFINLGYWLSAPANTPAQADLIVALGGGSGERDQMAAILYKAGYAENILLTGMVDIADAGKGFYKSPRTLFFLKQDIPAEALIFDGHSMSTRQEAINIAALLTAHHWRNALVISDPPHLRRVDYCLHPIFEKAGLNYRLIQSVATTWHPERWWQDKKWSSFCMREVVKLIYYTFVFRN